MQQTLLLRDETATGKLINEITVSFEHEEITVLELITARVKAEVDQYNNTLPEHYHGLVQPAYAEKVLNGYKMKERKKVDAEKQIYVALNAFQNNGFFLLINNKQVTELEESIFLTNATSISFVKLTPLVGG